MGVYYRRICNPYTDGDNKRRTIAYRGKSNITSGASILPNWGEFHWLILDIYCRWERKYAFFGDCARQLRNRNGATTDFL